MNVVLHIVLVAIARVFSLQFYVRCVSMSALYIYIVFNGRNIGPRGSIS